MLILSYFRKHWQGPVLFLLCAAICAVVFYLYDLPAESVLYAAALCLVPCLGWLIVDLLAYVRRVRALRDLTRSIRVSIERLPEPRDGVEGAYDALLRELWDEKSKLDAEYAASRREAEDYYAMWAHQIKTPIAAMRLLLQQGEAPDRAAVSAELFRIEQYVEMVLSYQRLGSDTVDLVLRRVELDRVLRGELSPVFFGSALTNFGVEPFLENFLRLTPTPLARVDSLTGEAVDPCRDEFSAFIFKIQANMNKAHRDRIAFMRICSGKFERGMEAYHVQEGKNIKLATGTQLMAQDRAIVDEAYAGDIIGLFDPGIFSIGDTLCTGKKKVEFAGIPTFSPEHFARIEQKDTMKRKQFVKGMEQIAQEGAIQIFREVGGGMEEVVVGVVGVLQLEVLEYRLNTEYNVEIRMQQLPFEQLRWIQNDPDTYVLRDLDLTSDTKAVEDMKGNRLLLFTSDWAIRWAETHNETLKLSEFGNI